MDPGLYDPLIDVSTAEIQTPLWMYLIAGVLILLILLLFIWGIWMLKRRLTRPEMYGLTREEMARRFKEVRATAKQGLLGSKMAILEADTLLDAALKSLMMPGDTLGERLKVACYKYPDLRPVWWAHKLRNQMAHDVSFNVSRREAEKAIDEFERALKLLNVL